MEMSMLLRHPRVLRGGQVWAGEQGPRRPTWVRLAYGGEKKLMKWQRDATSGATNEAAAEGRDGGEVLGETG